MDQENDAPKSGAEIVENVGRGQIQMVDQVENDPSGNRLVVNHLAVRRLDRIGTTVRAEYAVEQQVKTFESEMSDAGRLGSVGGEAIELAAQVGGAPEMGEYVSARPGKQGFVDGSKVVAQPGRSPEQIRDAWLATCPGGVADEVGEVDRPGSGIDIRFGAQFGIAFVAGQFRGK